MAYGPASNAKYESMIKNDPRFQNQDFVSGIFNATAKPLNQAGYTGQMGYMLGGVPMLEEDMSLLRQTIREMGVAGTPPPPIQQGSGAQPITTMPVSDAISFPRDATGMPLLTKFKGIHALDDASKIKQMDLNPWVSIRQQQMNADTQNLLNQGASQSASAAADAWSSLARRGGASGGSAQRLASQMAKDRMLASQGVRQQGAMANWDLLQGAKLKELEMNRGADKANLEAGLRLTGLAEDRKKAAFEQMMKRWVGQQL